jgi:hypothetical protein
MRHGLACRRGLGRGHEQPDASSVLKKSCLSVFSSGESLTVFRGRLFHTSYAMSRTGPLAPALSVLSKKNVTISGLEVISAGGLPL